MLLGQLFDPVSSIYTYLLASGVGREALIIVPVKEREDQYLHASVVKLEPAQGSRWATANSALMLLLAAINLGACRQPHSQSDPRTWTPIVEIAMVRPADAPQRAFTGVVVARVQSNLGFRVPGKVVQRLVNIGDSVRPGQALMQIDRNDLSLAIAARNAALASANARAIQTAADEGRYRELLDVGVATRQSYDQVKAAADTARAELPQAKAE